MSVNRDQSLSLVDVKTFTVIVAFQIVVFFYYFVNSNLFSSYKII